MVLVFILINRLSDIFETKVVPRIRKVGRKKTGIK
jgi:ABC-type dipeptide/oligopeptide/nickel transport system permease component